MSLLRIDEGNLAANLATVQRRGIMHFASTTERDQQVPSPEVGAVCVIPGATPLFQYWTGTAWVKFPPP